MAQHAAVYAGLKTYSAVLALGGDNRIAALEYHAVVKRRLRGLHRLLKGNMGVHDCDTMTHQLC